MTFDFDKKNLKMGKYIFSRDLIENRAITKMENYCDDTKVRLNVLPQPFFGKKDESNSIIFLAKNPSFDKYGDSYDTYLYLKDNDISNYVDKLKEVNFFESSTSGMNLYFYNTWKWWNEKVFGNINLKNGFNALFLNLSPYHSKFYTPGYRNFPSFDSGYVKEKLNSAELIFIVWGKEEWEKFLGLEFDKQEKIKYKIINLKENTKNFNIKTISSLYNDEKYNKILSNYFYSD